MRSLREKGTFLLLVAAAYLGSYLLLRSGLIFETEFFSVYKRPGSASSSGWRIRLPKSVPHFTDYAGNKIYWPCRKLEESLTGNSVLFYREYSVD